MTRILLAIATVGLLLFESSPGRAAYLGVAPWCAVMEVGAADVEWDCEYASVEACAPNVVAGNRGFCALNPYYSPPPTKGHARRHSHTQ